jgi:hypothetical protein
MCGSRALLTICSWLYGRPHFPALRFPHNTRACAIESYCYFPHIANLEHAKQDVCKYGAKNGSNGLDNCLPRLLIWICVGTFGIGFSPRFCQPSASHSFHLKIINLNDLLQLASNASISFSLNYTLL